MKKFHFFLVAIMASGSACFPVLQMQPNVVNGGRAVALSRHPSNNNEFFVASESGGIFRSADAGATWSQVTGSHTFWFSDVKYCTANPAIIIATAHNDTKTVNGGGIWRSTDNGSSWTQIAIAPPSVTCAASLSAYCIAIEPVNNKIWVGTSCGLAVSSDNGASFSFIPVSTFFNNDAVYAVLAPAQNQIKILTDSGVKVSGNDGTSWSFSTTGLPYVAKGEHAQIACSPLNHQHIFWASNFSPWDGKWHNGIYYSFDNGTTWQNLIDNIGRNRSPTCFTASALSGQMDKFDLYYSDGGCTLQRASFTNTTPPVISGSWTNLTTPHCDYADLSFKTDGKSPALLAGDGGLFATSDNGMNWSFTGGGDKGYDALQITEVIGQLHSGDKKSDLYYATQDNDLRASSDNGATWPNSYCCEGFYLNIPRQSLPPADTKFTGVACWTCRNIITGPAMSGGVFTFPDVPNATYNPRLIQPATYIQSDTLSGAPTVSIFSLTTNTGGSWTPKYAFTNAQRDLSKVTSSATDPVVFTAVQNSGSTPDGNEIVGIKKIVDVLGSGSPIVSDVTGFGSLGIFPTMFAWYKPFGPDIFDPNHIIAPDIISDMVKVTWDGGATWKNDTMLTRLVTGSGALKYRKGPFTQISNIAYDPTTPGHILVGTVQAGIFVTCNGGTNWSKVEGTEYIPNVSSFYFLGKKLVVVSSYGRGLWKLTLDACPELHFPHEHYNVEEPLIYWKGAYVPISQIHDPDVCPVCGYLLIQQGDISEVNVNQGKNEIRSIGITKGKISAYKNDGSPNSNIGFDVITSAKSFDASSDQPLVTLMEKGYKVKGIYFEGKMFKGLLLGKEDIRPGQLPKREPMNLYVHADLVRDQKTDMVTGVKLRGKGFNQNSEIMISIDGQRIDLRDAKPSFDKEGNMEFNLNILLTPGGHTILLEQKGANSTISQATTIIVPLNDNNQKRN